VCGGTGSSHFFAFGFFASGVDRAQQWQIKIAMEKIGNPKVEQKEGRENENRWSREIQQVRRHGEFFASRFSRRVFIFHFRQDLDNWE
jgi:hypothetical protein